MSWQPPNLPYCSFFSGRLSHDVNNSYFVFACVSHFGFISPLSSFSVYFPLKRKHDVMPLFRKFGTIFTINTHNAKILCVCVCVAAVVIFILLSQKSKPFVSHWRTFFLFLVDIFFNVTPIQRIFDTLTNRTVLHKERDENPLAKIHRKKIIISQKGKHAPNILYLILVWL